MARFKKIRSDVKSYATGAVLAVLVFGLFAIWSVGCAGSGSSNPPQMITTNAQPTSVYGSNTGQMDLYKTSATFTDSRCGTIQLSGPIVPDQNGNFQVTGFYPTNIPVQATYSGNIQGNTMNLTVTPTNPNQGRPVLNYTLTLGVSGQFVAGTCP